MNILQFLIDIRSRENGVIGQVNRLQGRIDAANQSAERLSRTVGGGLREAFLSLPGAEFFTNPIVALTAGVGAVSKLGMEAGKTAVSFDVLLGSQEKSAEMLRMMNRYAADSPYGRLGVQEAAKTMLGFGVAEDQVMSSLKMLGDIAGGSEEQFKGLALVFSQVAAAGKLQGQDLLQLISNGYNPLMDISRMTGKSVSQLREEMSEGKISFEMMRQAMMSATSEGGKFYGMIDRINNTPFGRFGQLVDQGVDTLLSLYKVVEPLLIPAFDALSGVLTSIQPVIEGMASAMSWLTEEFRAGNPLIIGLTAAVGAYSAVAAVNTFVLKGWTVAQWAHVTALIAAEKAQKLLNIAMSLNPVGRVIAGIAALVAVIAVCWNKFAGFRAFILTAWDTIKGFGEMIWDAVVSRFWALVEGIGAVGKALVALVKGDFKSAWQEARTGAEKIGSIYNPSDLVEGTRRLAGQTAGNWNRHLEEERRKQADRDKGIAEPKAAAGVAGTKAGASVGTPSGTSSSSSDGKAEEITTGGTRNTQVTVHIAKFFDSLNVTMMDRTDTGELRRIVLECMNRSIETALSAAR